MLTHTLGFPRIGADRELKKATEKHWREEISEKELLETAKKLRLRHWTLQQQCGVNLVPVGDFSFYDHMLDAAAMLGAVPERFEWKSGNVDLKTYFRMARGDASRNMTAMEMTKWFDTNYHYIVPEFHSGQTFDPSTNKLEQELREATEAGFAPKAVLPGPITFMALGKSVEQGFDHWSLLDGVVDAYCRILENISGLCEWIQLDEPVLVFDLEEDVKKRFAPVYEKLKKAAGKSKIMLATYFGGIEQNLGCALDADTHCLHLDLVRAPGQLDAALDRLPKQTMLSLGLVNGRNIWKVEMDPALALIGRAIEKLGAERVMIGSSCSLLHTPLDLENEDGLDAEIKSWMAFAKQKCTELHILNMAAQGLNSKEALRQNREAWKLRRSSSKTRNQKVRNEMQAVDKAMMSRKSPYVKRAKKQQEKLGLPLYPTTTIGSYPQTPEIRITRRKFKTGKLSQKEYTLAMQDFIRDAVERQEELGLDVLVHGEPERNDMVEYFGEQLDGFCFTKNGWVQSYGTRNVKPPIIFGDVSRPAPMTVDWIGYAQSLTPKPVKGMLTGPVTILCWSFVRDDQPLSETCQQIALAIRKEVRDLEKSGAGIIQIDEPALREGLPLRKADWDEYLEWAVNSFKLSTCAVADETQIHTHMCYAEFNEIIKSIADMDADVISIEASRSRMTLLDAFQKFKYPNEIGPGVWDIHSPRVPSAEEMGELLDKAAKVIPTERLWVNPDCGLKTRDWPETLASLKNMVSAARKARDKAV